MTEPAPRVQIEKLRAGMQRQLEIRQQAIAAGVASAGWKVAINVPEVQRRLGLPHAALGWIRGDRVLTSGAEIAAPSGSQLCVEAEAAVRIDGPVPPRASVAVARGSIDAVYPALELVDYARPSASLDDLLSHSVFHAGCVLGSPLTLEDWERLPRDRPRLFIGDTQIARTRHDLVPDDLGRVVSFVARYLSHLDLALESGDLILAGCYMDRATPVRDDQRVCADFGSAGDVELRVSGAPTS